MKFKDKVVIITWASRWIWRATALYFWKEWATVVVNYLSSGIDANKVVKSIIKLWWNSIAIKWDVSCEDNVKKIVDRTINTFWKIDILVNNAWISNDVPILERTVDQWKRTMDVNLLGTFLCSKYVVKEMLKNKNLCKIINVSSINWSKFFAPDLIDYDISKLWIIALTKNFAKAFSPNIIVNAIAPWNVNTEITKLSSFDNYDDEIINIYSNRFWELAEIVKVILFLSSDESNYINWTVIYVDWGFSC